MLATLVKEVHNNPEFIYEIKWDGYRIIAFVKDGTVRLASRSNLDYSKKYPLIVEALRELKHEVILDGEVVVFKNGSPDFDSLQTYNGSREPISYYLFDLLWLDGHNIMNLPLTKRKSLLHALIDNNDVLKFSESFDDGNLLYQKMLEKGWEGIVAKRKDSEYMPGQRGNAWLKTPTLKRQEFVIGGWAESDKARLFRSLLFGAYNQDGQFEWIGRSGGGFKHKEMPDIMKQLESIEISKSPFVNKVLDTKGAIIHYVQPILVASFAFATWTKSGRIRKPATFLGFRKDKNPLDVTREIPQDLENNVSLASAPILKSRTFETENREKIYLNEDSNWIKLDKLHHTNEQTLPVDGHELVVYDLDRMLWKNERIRKGDLMSYYASISKYILPYLRNRPLSLYIKPLAPEAPGIYLKDMEGRQPEFAEVFQTERKHRKKGKRDVIEYLVCNNTATLLYVVNLGAIDFNPWNSTVHLPDVPEYITIDLDPSDGDFSKAIETAKAAKELFDEYNLTSFIKTSGKTGIHILIPCNGFTHSQARSIGSYLCDEIQRKVPAISTRERNVDKRGNLLYVDDSQNDFADTIASAYSVRPYQIPSVSTPLGWKEVRNGLNPGGFTIKTIPKRLGKFGDMFEGLFDQRNTIINNKILSFMKPH